MPLTGKRFSANVISAIGADGTLVFEIFEGTCDEIRFLDFLDKLLEHFAERKIFLIVDNASFHKSPAVEYWLLDHPRMELFYLPPYAPELNPDELLNQDVHTHVARRRPSNLAKLVILTVEYLATRTSEIVSEYFDGSTSPTPSNHALIATRRNTGCRTSRGGDGNGGGGGDPAATSAPTPDQVRLRRPAEQLRPRTAGGPKT